MVIGQNRRRDGELANPFSKPIDVALVFAKFKIVNLFSVKDAFPEELRTGLVYTFSCIDWYVGKQPTFLHTCDLLSKVVISQVTLRKTVQ